MLFFEPVKDKETIPGEIASVVRALAKRGFGNPYAGDLELINLGRTTPLIEKDGKFFYNGVVVGYLRALQPTECHWV
jgi:hypothetical protein